MISSSLASKGILPVRITILRDRLPQSPYIVLIFLPFRPTRSTVGLLPGEARGLARFERAVQTLSRGGVPLADVADEAGYADQSHLTRDLRARCGLSPAQLAAAAPFVPGHLDEGQLRSRRVTDRVRRSGA